LQDPYDTDVLFCTDETQEDADQEFLAFLNTWTGLTSVLNEFSLGMGLPDFYPFVLSTGAVTKLHFVHRFIEAFAHSPTPLEAAT
ncbi:MAG: putative zinc-binding metallopeptidase, partial [Rhodoferax sp.]|nr:putative zinc-binding metallopeptidase [Rhodoferax sp.]